MGNQWILKNWIGFVPCSPRMDRMPKAIFCKDNVADHLSSVSYHQGIQAGATSHTSHRQAHVVTWDGRLDNR